MEICVVDISSTYETKKDVWSDILKYVELDVVSIHMPFINYGSAHNRDSSNISVAVQCFRVSQGNWQCNKSIVSEPFLSRHCKIFWDAVLFNY